MTASQPDILVVGGGPAGLLLASKIGLHHNIMLIDKHNIGTTDKYWISSVSRLRAHDLDEYTSFRTASCTFGTFLGEPVTVPGDFAVVDEKALLKRLKQRCLDNRVTLVENCQLQSLKRHGPGFRVNTSQGEVRSTVLVDASGGNSPIASTFSLHKLVGFFTICASHLTGLKLSQRSIPAGHILNLGNPPLILELAPTSEDSAFCAVFSVTRRAQNPEWLKKKLIELLEQSPFCSLSSKTRWGDLQIGVIPIGTRKRRWISGLFSYGEAGLLQSPLLGGAFNEVLMTVDSFSDAVCSFLVDPMKRQWVQGHRKKWNDVLQLALAKYLIDASVEDFEHMVRFLKGMGGARAYKLLCGELSLVSMLLLMPGTLKLTANSRNVL